MDNNIIEKINKAKQNHFINNCYSPYYINKSDILCEIEDSFLLTYNDHGINRILFFVEDYDVLDDLLLNAKNGKYYIEILSKNPQEINLNNPIIVTNLMRMVNPDCNSVFLNDELLLFRNDKIAKLAREEDTAEINNILWDTFKTEISHLLYDEELYEIIKEHKVFIHKSQKIDAILQIDVKPKKFYINQIINRTDRSVIHAILLSQLWQYVQNGGKYMYAWVEEKNVSSIKFHQKYDMKHDGMWNIIYCMENI